MLFRVWRHLPELLGVAAVLWTQFRLRDWLLECATPRRLPWLRRLIHALTIALALWIAAGLLTSLPSAYALLPATPFLYWARGAAIGWAMASFAAFLLLWLWRRVPRFNPERRGVMRAAGGALLAAPFAAMGYGVMVQRLDLRLREIDLPMPGLSPDLDGLRLVQLSDIHLSPFLRERDLARAVDMANELQAHVALVTGDLITCQGDPLDVCLRQVARLRADAGILGCLGNHEIYAHATRAAAEGGARLGIDFLRRRARRLRFGNATLNVVGVDYQRMGSQYLTGAEELVVPGATNLLLSHNPDVFDAAASKGYDLTVSGHTHGGQVNIEILSQSLNPARFHTRYVYGLYRQGRAAIWVTRGIGTVGLPARIGAPPEIALIRLCATSS